MSVPKQKPGRSKQDYATPDNFIRATKWLLRIKDFTIDLAADSTNRKAALWFDEPTNALHQPQWEQYTQRKKQWAWLNPPYADIRPWACRCAYAVRKGARIAFLVPASVGSNWFVDHVYNCPQTVVFFLQGRLAFMPDKPTWLYPKDCMLVLYDPDMRVGPKFDVWNWRENV